MEAEFILASGSPRRRELLDRFGFRYHIVRTGVDESIVGDEAPEAYVQRVALLKARWAHGQDGSTLPVLAADTTVVLDGKIIGKPENEAQAADMLRTLSGRTHSVYSAVVLLPRAAPALGKLNVTRVSFATLDNDWINAYCASGEPMDKAGAYAMQGRAAEFISHLEGSPSGVMGLPMFETLELLRSVGIRALPGLT